MDTGSKKARCGFSIRELSLLASMDISSAANAAQTMSENTLSDRSTKIAGWESGMCRCWASSNRLGRQWSI